MLTYVLDFNLKVAGNDAEQFLLSAVRDWPALYARLPGVRGTLFLANAFALGGEYTYQWRVGIDNFATLQAIDDAVKSKDPAWRKARAEYFANRAEVRARLQRVDGGATDYAKQHSGKGGLLHYAVGFGAADVGSRRESLAVELRSRIPEVLRGCKGVRSLQQLTTVIDGSASAQQETWARLDDLAALEDLVKAQDSLVGPLLRAVPVSTRIFGELREVNGALLSGA